ncbi:hypothetical protein BH708_02630 [Brachybacterium sp. P6-10-X1]|nr:hypothetical protein BH708_02630 [Brachybacterium sp. P6-10-X1]
MDHVFHVDVFADPGLPSRAVTQVLDTRQEDDSEAEFVLHHNRRWIPLRDDGTLDMEAVKEWAHRDEADLMVIVTEIPRRAGRRVKMVGLHFEEGAAIISLPALGWSNVGKNLRAAMFDSLDALATDKVPGSGDTRIEYGVVHEQDSETGRSVYIASPWWWPGTVRLILGMVRTNEPFATVTKLSGVLAAAAGTGAFGIFYSSIWEMADALPPWRLGLITVMVIATMVLWLLVSNGLWERSRQLGSLREAAMYNASTVATLFVAVASLYAVLFVGILLGGLIVIEAGFMSKTIGVEVSPWNYVDIAWLSASMGTVAGALGSNFDSRDDISELTHGRRQAQRFRQRQEEAE